MTNLNDTLDPIRPDDGTVGDNMPSGDVEVVQAQEEIIGDEDIENVEKDAEVQEEMRRPKLAARPYTPTRAEVYEHEVTHLLYRKLVQTLCTGAWSELPPCETRYERDDRDYNQHGLLFHEWRG